MLPIHLKGMKTGNRVVLIIEDEPSIRETLQLALELEGYTVFTASHGQEGLDALTRISRPCLILLDLMMPVMDGWDFASALKGRREFSQIPIVVITAFDERVRKIEAQAIIKKPIAMEELLDTVSQYCG